MVKFLVTIVVFLLGIIVGMLIDKDNVINNYFKNRKGIQNIDNATAVTRRKLRIPKLRRKTK